MQKIIIAMIIALAATLSTPAYSATAFLEKEEDWGMNGVYCYYMLDRKEYFRKLKPGSKCPATIEV